MKAKREINKTFVGVIVTITTLGSLVLIFFSPEVPVIAKLVFGASLLGVAWLLVWSKLDRHFKQSLGQEMRNASKIGHASMPAS